jgi:hypothetical protein
MHHVDMVDSGKLANQADQKKLKYVPGRLGQYVDETVKLLASWPAEDRRSVEVRREQPRASSTRQVHGHS